MISSSYRTDSTLLSGSRPEGISSHTTQVSIVFRGNCWLNMKRCGTLLWRNSSLVYAKHSLSGVKSGQKYMVYSQCKLKIEQFHLSHHLVLCKNIEEAVLHMRCKKTDVSDVLHTTAPESVIKCKISSQLIMFPSESYSINANERITRNPQTRT